MMFNKLLDKDVVNNDSSSFSTETLICPICGTSYENSKKGRTKSYCSDNCQQFNKYKNAMVDKLININFNDEESRLIKGELFTIANLIKIPKKKGLAK